MPSMDDVLGYARDMLDMEEQARSARMLDHNGHPMGGMGRRYWAARNALRKLVDSKWETLPAPPLPPVCDLCSHAAAWKHPKGGLRCNTCPRPEE